MYVSRHNIGNLYDNILLKEMNQRLIDYLEQEQEEYESELPFPHIFGDVNRIYIPMSKDSTAKDILETLKNIKDYGGVDIHSGEVIRKIKLDPRYSSEGEKEQRINIGSAISKSKIDPDTKKRYLDWLGRYKNNISEALGAGKYGIIISRSPIDVIRMSDFKELKSCHSQPNKFPGQSGRYFECAVQEAINGGGVAYIVNNDDLAKAFDDGITLNDTDLFNDDDRNVGGSIIPLARLRLRRLSNRDNDNDFAVTDDRIYGDNTIPGFRKAVDQYIKERQIGEEEFGQHTWVSRGGTYFDTENDIKDLVDEYFKDSGREYPNYSHDKDDIRGESRREDTVKRLSVNLQQECQKITNEWNEAYNCFEVGADIVDNDDIMPSADFSLYMKSWGVPELMNLSISFEDDGEVRDAIEGNYDTEEIYWSTLLEWVDGLIGKEFDCYIYSFKIENGFIEFVLSLGDNYSIMNNVEGYSNFCRYIEQIDNNMYEFDDWEEVLGDSGVMQRLSKNPLKTLMKLGVTLDYLTVKLHSPKSVEFRVLLDAVRGSYTQYSGPDARVDDSPIADYRAIGDAFGSMLSNYVKNYYRPEREEGIETFEETYNRLTSSGMDVFTQYYINEVDIEFAPYDYVQNSTILLDVRFKVSNFNYINSNLLLFLNNNLDDLKNMATFAYLAENRYIHPGSARYKNQFNALKRVYGKLM